jgi:hypothetical protein
MPRTEEVSNAILLQVPHAGAMLARAALVLGTDAHPESAVDAARVSVQITRAGHVKMRLSWAAPVVLAPDCEQLQRAAAQVRDLVLALTRVLCALC